jgi:predicted NUDIX family phosphoesterase
MKEKTELQLIPAELNTAIKDTKIEHSKAEQHALAFAPSMQEYLTYAEIIKGLNRENPTDKDAKIARENRLKLVKVRTNAEGIKDLRKEGIRAEGDLIQALFNVVKNSCLVTETEFTEIEKHQERLEEKRQADLSASRIELLAVFGTDTTYLPLGIMTDEQFSRLLENETLAFNARKAQAEKAETDRIEAERLAEEARQSQIKKDAEEREAQRLENIRLQKENEEARLAADRLAKENEAKLAEQNRIAAAELKKQKDAADKLAAELKAKQDAEFKEHQRLEAQAKRELQAKQDALLAPDKDKIRVFYEALKVLISEIPTLESEQGKFIASMAMGDLKILQSKIIEESKKLI